MVDITCYVKLLGRGARHIFIMASLASLFFFFGGGGGGASL